MKIQIGRTYLTLGGDKIKILERSLTSENFYGKSYSNKGIIGYWCLNGEFNVDCPNRKLIIELTISEYPEYFL